MDVNKLIVDIVERDTKNIRENLEEYLLELVFQDIHPDTYQYLIENEDHVTACSEMLSALTYFQMPVTI